MGKEFCENLEFLRVEFVVLDFFWIKIALVLITAYIPIFHWIKCSNFKDNNNVVYIVWYLYNT